jgi:hypothetical protein
MKKIPSWQNVLLLLTLLIGACSVWGTQPAQAAPGTQNLDIIVIIDNSGSMHSNYKSSVMTGSDPYGLRYEATNMLVDLLDEKDRIGVVHFSKTARTVDNQMFRLSPEVKTDFRKKISDMAVDYTNVPANPKTVAPFDGTWVVRDPAVEPNGTFYKTAFSNTKALLDASESGNKRAVIFLTDGAPEDLGEGDDITANTTAALKELGVPVFLLALQPDTASNADTFAKVSAGFTQANQRVIPIASAFDIARAMASVITYLKPSAYLDVIDGAAGSGTNTAAYITSAIKGQQIEKATFVFASNANKNQLTVTEKKSPFAGKSGATTGRFRSFYYEKAGGIDGKFEFTANANPTDITSFVFVQSALEVVLRYPDETATDSAIMGFPRGASSVLVGATVTNLEQSLFSSVRVSTLASCEDYQSSTLSDAPAQQNGLNKSGDTVFWETIKESDKPIYVGVGVQQVGSINLRRCYEFQPSSVELPVEITSPTIASPKLNADSELHIETSLPDTNALSMTNGLVFTQPIDGAMQALGDDSVAAEDLAITDGSGSADIESDPGVQSNVRVVIPGVFEGRPIALYQQRIVTPSMSCAFVLENPTSGPSPLQDETGTSFVDMGVITSPEGMRNALVCVTKIRGGSIPTIDTSKLTMRGQNGSAGNPALLQFDEPTMQKAADGKTTIRYPFTLGDVSALPEDNYTIETQTVSGGTKESLQLRFTRPKSSWQWDILPDGFSFTDTIDEINPLTSECVRAYPVLSPDAVLKPELVVSDVYVGTQKASANDLTAMIQPDTTCPGGYRIIIDGSRLAPGDYTFNVAGQTSNPAVPVQPALRGVKVKRGSPLIQIVFPENRRVQDVPGTFSVDSPLWPIWIPFINETQISYSAILTHTRTMPVIDNPLSQTVADVHDNNALVNAAYDFSWTPANLNTRSHLYDGYLVETNLPWFRWPGTEYDVQMNITDPRVVSPKQVTLRVPTHSWWDVIKALLSFLLSLMALRWLWTKLSRSYAGSVRFTQDDLQTNWIPLRSYGKSPLSIVRTPYGGFEDLRVVPKGSELEDDVIVGSISPRDGASIDVSITNDDLNPYSKSKQFALLNGKSARFGDEGIRVSYK